MRNAITCTVDAVGNLTLTLAAECRDEFAERMEAVGEDNALWEATESYWTNGSFQPFSAGDANPFVGLSDAPCIAECMDTHDNGEPEIVGRFWYFPAYMVKSYGQELLDTGRTTFNLVR